MATMLLPPSIEAKLPAQVEGEEQTFLYIPYQHSRAVNANDYSGFSLKISTVFSNSLVAVVNGEDKINYAQFPLVDKDGEAFSLNIGQYYKVQLAYIGNDSKIGYYSTVGVFKYTAEPTVKFSGTEMEVYYTELITNFIENPSDPSEHIYSYQFDIYKEIDEKNCSLFESSGELFEIKYDSNKTELKYKVKHLYEPGVSYKFVCSVKTINGYMSKCELKNTTPIKDYISVENENIKKLIVETDLANGCNKIDIQNLNGAKPIALIRRKNGSLAEILYNGFVSNKTGQTYRYYDFSIEQGIEYEYNIYWITEHGELYTLQMPKKIKNNFEDIFISDGERQLCVRYNPKVSSFKENILESKMDTIGGRFPFILRNGNSRFKEFSIGGLLSYHMDNDNLFMNNFSRNTPTRTSTKATESNVNEFIQNTNLSEYNVMTERQFKLEALSWLNNGKPKLFRSPTEGNYIVRLMNISLSPEDTLGRMLHSFQATAYEVAELTEKNLTDLGFVKKHETFSSEPILNGMIIKTTDGKTIADKNSVIMVLEG